MKIGSPDSKPAAAPSGPDRQANTPIKQPLKGGAVAAAAPEPSAKVALSSSANALKASQIDPTFDTAKVDRIAQAIRDGKFEVNADAIADKLIQNAQELLGRRAS
jgi:negative regulator of flagellin synthesis FlgM